MYGESPGEHFVTNTFEGEDVTASIAGAHRSGIRRAFLYGAHGAHDERRRPSRIDYRTTYPAAACR